MGMGGNGIKRTFPLIMYTRKKVHNWLLE